jgi:hypothetical protein
MYRYSDWIAENKQCIKFISLHAMMQWRTQEFCSWGGSTNSVDTGQRERGSGGGSPLVRDSAQFANEWNPYSYYVVTDDLPRNWKFGSALSKFRNFGGWGLNPLNTPLYATAIMCIWVPCNVHIMGPNGTYSTGVQSSLSCPKSE